MGLVACGEVSPPGWTSTSDATGGSTTSAGTGATVDPPTPTTMQLSTSEPLPSCGDGVLDPGESCDDGNLEPNDGCDANCTPMAAVEWTYTHNGGAGGDDSATGVAIDADGCVFVVGAEAVQSRDALILALAPDGREMWRKTIDTAGFEDAFLDVVIDGDRLYAAGYEEIAAGVKSAVIRAFSHDGADLWKFSEPAPAGFARVDGLALADGALYSTGSESAPQDVTRLAIRRHDALTGAATWKTTTAGGATSARAGGIAATGPRMLAAGHVELAQEVHPLLVTIDHAGVIESEVFEAEQRGLWSDVAAIGGDGDVIVSGRLEVAPEDGFDVAARRIAADGAVLWTRTVDHRHGLDAGAGVAVGDGAAVFVAGVVSTRSEDLEIFGGRFTGAGERRWTHVHANRGLGLDDHGAAAAFGPGFIVLVGDEAVPGQGTDVWVRRFSAQ